jgi:hypothetical protein
MNPDPNHPDEGVELAFKYVGSSFGAFTQTAWALDDYGAVLSHSDPDTGTSGDEQLDMEYFVVDGGSAKISYRLRGKQDPQYLFERVYWGRSKADDMSAGVWDDSVKVYDSSYNASAEGEISPATLFIQYPSGSPGDFSVYPGDPTDGTAKIPDANVEGDPAGTAVPRQIFWLGGSGTSLQAGDSVYQMLSHETESGDEIIQYYEVAEVPETASVFGYSGQFHVQEMYPLKYVTGSFNNGDTVIQVAPNAISTPDGAEDRYYVDANSDTSYATTTQIDDNEPPDVELIVWKQDSFSYYDEAQQKEVTVNGTPWVVGNLPDVPMSGGSLTYLYESQRQDIASRFSGMDIESGDSITDTTVDPFPVLQEKWKDIQASEF